MKGIYAFQKSINPKVIVIARLKFEPAYYGLIVQHLSHQATGTPRLAFRSESLQ